MSFLSLNISAINVGVIVVSEIELNVVSFVDAIFDSALRIEKFTPPEISLLSFCTLCFAIKFSDTFLKKVLKIEL